MKKFSLRSVVISAVAITGAVIWGTVEVLALQWSGAVDRLHAAGKRGNFGAFD